MNFAHSGSARRVAAGALISLALLVAGADLAWRASAAPVASTGTKITLRHSPSGKVLAGDARRFIYVHIGTGGKDAACASLLAAHLGQGQAQVAISDSFPGSRAALSPNTIDRQGAVTIHVAT
jgi:hypothetical protein